MERVYKKQGTRKRGLESSENPSGKLRIAAYVRTSTMMISQETSFETQVETFRKKIESNPDWVLVEIFADHGISGTQAKKRPEFMRMLECCREGKIDRILTKSISRFARNTLDCVRYVRELTSLGVTVYFEKEDIDTGAAYSEILLTVMAAFAQEESRSMSENIKWGYQKRFQQGIATWKDLFGYKKVGEQKYVVDKEEAKVIQEMFSLYENGLTTDQIAEILTAKKIRTRTGIEKWSRSIVNRLLSNEKYIGDVRMQKRYTDNSLTKHMIINDGSIVPMYYVKDDHDPIIPRDQFERVQKIKEMRASVHGPHTYPFGKEYLKCPYCGKPLQRHQIPNYGSPWICDSCHKFAIYHDDICFAVLRALQQREEFKDAESVEYIMLEKAVDHIEIGNHENENERFVKVFYKDGTSTSELTEITQKNKEPTRLAAKVLAQLQSVAALLQTSSDTEEGDQ